MMFQKGPGEGYGAAKDEVLALDPSLRCKNATAQVGQSYYVVIRKDGKRVGAGASNARGAWLSALSALQAGFAEDHSVGSRRRGREGRSISHSYGGEGRNFVD